MSATPDYAALVKLFPILRNCVDGCGEVTLTADEAAQIRLLGFRAEEGRWSVPPVPPELVADNPLLENLSIGWNTRQNPSQPISTNGSRQESKSGVPQTPARTSDVQPGPMDRWQTTEREGLTELNQRILRAVKNAGGRIFKRQLQKKFWRFRAKAFSAALCELFHDGSLSLEGNWVVACSTHIRSGPTRSNPAAPHPETAQESDLPQAIADR